jgi:hypothetical protein
MVLSSDSTGCRNGQNHRKDSGKRHGEPMLTQDQINQVIGDISMAIMANDFMRANAIMTQIRGHVPDVRIPTVILKVRGARFAVLFDFLGLE